MTLFVARGIVGKTCGFKSDDYKNQAIAFTQIGFWEPPTATNDERFGDKPPETKKPKLRRS